MARCWPSSRCGGGRAQSPPTTSAPPPRERWRRRWWPTRSSTASRPSPAHNLTDERISQVTDLPAPPGEEEALLELIDASARRNVRKARRTGIVAAPDAERLGVGGRHPSREHRGARRPAPRTRASSRPCPRHFAAGADYDVYVGPLDDTVVAGLLLFYFNGTVEYFTPAVDHDHRSDQPLAVVLVEAMAAAARRGCRRWNWGGTWTSQDGVLRFKRKWGAREGRYRYYVQVNDDALLDARPEELRARFGHFYVVPFSALRSAGGS